MTKYLQQTVGKMIMGIKSCSERWGQTYMGLRSFSVKSLEDSFRKCLFIPYLLVLFMPKKEALHDLFADTVVVHEHAYEKETSCNDRPKSD